MHTCALPLWGLAGSPVCICSCINDANLALAKSGLAHEGTLARGAREGTRGIEGQWLKIDTIWPKVGTPRTEGSEIFFRLADGGLQGVVFYGSERKGLLLDVTQL